MPGVRSLQQLLVLALGHIRPEDARIMPTCPGLYAREDERGWMIHIEPGCDIRNIQGHGGSDYLCEVVEFAMECGCNYLRVIADGPIHPEFSYTPW